MKKTIFALAIAFGLFGAMPMSAATANDNPTEQTCKKDKKCKKDKECRKDKECKKDKKCKDGKRHCDKGRHGNPAFEGIELSADQQAKLQALNNSFREEKSKLKEERKELRRECREKYDEAVAAILTPEQMARYKDNRNHLDSVKFRKFDGKQKFEGHFDRKNGPKFEMRRAERLDSTLLRAPRHGKVAKNNDKK